MKLRVAVPERFKRLAPAGVRPVVVDAAVSRQLASRGPQLATVLLAGAIAAQLALLAWKFLPNQAPPLPTVGAAPSGPAFDPSAILNAHLFGSAAPVAGPADSAPVTQVALVLVGTIAATDPAKGLAIVGENPQGARVYAVGQQLPGGVKLHSVYPDRIVLDRGGALETLPLPRQVASGTGIVVPGASTAETSAPGDGTEPPLAESVQRLIAQGPEVVGEMLRPMPAFANGQLQGFRLYPGRDRQKFAKLGLQPGDLVTQVNGVPLADAQRGMEILRGLGNAGTANVTIERGGAVQQITINASQIASMTAPVENPADE